MRFITPKETKYIGKTVISDHTSDHVRHVRKSPCISGHITSPGRCCVGDKVAPNPLQFHARGAHPLGGRRKQPTHTHKV